MALQILDQPAQPVQVVPDHSQGDVALLAQQAANAPAADPAATTTRSALAGAALVVVVDAQTGSGDTVAVGRGYLAARLAGSALLVHHAPKVRKPDAVKRPQLAVQVCVGRVDSDGSGPSAGARFAVPASPLAGRSVVALDHLAAAAWARLHAAILPYSGVWNAEDRRGR